MFFDMKEARDKNTLGKYEETVWRVFLNGKLFISDKNRTSFDNIDDARLAVANSSWMKTINEWLDTIQKLFKKEGDDKWREEFLQKVLKNMNLEFKEYGPTGKTVNSQTN